MVEMDLRFTADRVPVILHDDSLRRTFGPSRPIVDLRWEEARALAPALPSLEEAVATCKHCGLGIYLEIKAINHDASARALEILRQYDYLRATIIASFRVDLVSRDQARVPRAIDLGALQLRECGCRRPRAGRRRRIRARLLGYRTG